MAKPRGWWLTSPADKARAQYQADQIAAATAAQSASLAAELNEAYRKGWADGRAALLAEMRQGQRPPIR